MTEHQNVDNAEIAKFEAIAERWWDLEGEFKPLHEINPLRLDFIADKTKGLFDKEEESGVGFSEKWLQRAPCCYLGQEGRGCAPRGRESV